VGLSQAGMLDRLNRVRAECLGGEMDEDDPYQELRPLLFSIAYRMVGSVSEAEDIVQESFLRFHTASGAGARFAPPRHFSPR